MHHLVVEGWSRCASPLHSLDPRAKIVALLVLLIAVSTTHSPAAFAAYGLALLSGIAIARLPMIAVFMRALVIVPFVATFALITWLAGQPEHALSILEKSFVSALGALLLIATTPMNDLLRGLESLAVPRALILVIQFLYRYLFVVAEQAQHMRMAARARGSRFHSGAGAIAVLFARSWERADGIYQAMLARGFAGRFTTLGAPRFSAVDAIFVLAASAAFIAIRVTL